MQKMILVSCSDGRITGAAGRASAFAATHGFELGETSVYRIKIPGPDGSCIGVRGGAHQEALREDIGVLIDKTNAALVSIAGHSDCAGYIVSDTRHTEDTITAARALHAWYPQVAVMALVDHEQKDGTWTYEEVAYIEAEPTA